MRISQWLCGRMGLQMRALYTCLHDEVGRCTACGFVGLPLLRFRTGAGVRGRVPAKRSAQYKRPDKTTQTHNKGRHK